jgi:16S rRNA (adenine1518-N6/adenine1519-N6)-dimethyltransferase
MLRPPRKNKKEKGLGNIFISSSLPADFQAKKRLGQHFLVDEEILSVEAALLSCGGKTALEIGAGDGRLSEKLLSFRPSSLSLSEIDPALIGVLKKKFSKEKSVKIIAGDAMDIVRAAPKAGFFQCVGGNIPYQISGPLFSALSGTDLERGVFCVQREVAQRICASPGSPDWGKLSVVVQLKHNARVILPVPPSSFSPPPKVDSAIILLERKPAGEILPVPENFHRVLSALSCHRLQSVGNALFNSRTALGISKERAKPLSKTIKYSGSKVFTLSIAQWREIALELGG